MAACLLSVLTTGQSQELRLAGMTEDTFSKWLVGTKWKRKKDGIILHYVTENSFLVIHKFKSRTKGYWIEKPGVIAHAFNGQRTAPPTFTEFSANLKSATVKAKAFKDSMELIGRGKLKGLGEGKLTAGNSEQFTKWLEGKQLVSDDGDTVIRFKDGKIRGLYRKFYGDDPATFRVVEPGLVEFSNLGDKRQTHYLTISPDLSSFFIPWRITDLKGKVEDFKAEEIQKPEVVARWLGKGFPNSLSQMSKEEFSQWIVGTRWHDGTITLDVLSSKAIHVGGTTDTNIAFGYVVTEPGKMRMFYRGDKKSKNTFTITEGLQSAKWGHVGRPTTGYEFIERVVPPSLGRGKLAKMTSVDFERWLREHRFKVPGKKAIDMTFLEDGTVENLEGSKDGKVSYQVLSPGFVQMVRGAEGFLRPIMIVSSDLSKFYLSTKSSGFHGNVLDLSGESADPDSDDPGTSMIAPGFDLSQLKNIPLKRRTSGVQSLLLSPLGNSLYAAQAAKLSISVIELSSEKPATIGFNQAVGKLMSSALKEVIRYQVIRNGGWPKGANIELAFAEQYSQKDGPSAAVACTLLLESVFTGEELSKDIAVTGDLNSDGSVQPVGGVSSKIRGAEKAGMKVVGIPVQNRDDVLDLLILEGPSILKSPQVFSLETFDDAIRIARKERDPELKGALAKYKQLISSGAKGAALQKGLREILEVAPNHVSARLLLLWATNGVPDRLTLRGSISLIDQSTGAVIDATNSELSSTSGLDAGEVSAVRNDLQRIRAKIDPRIRSYCDAWINWADQVDRILGSGKVNRGEVKELKVAGAQIDAAREAINKDVSIQDELIR